jgi:hypothetical protein
MYWLGPDANGGIVNKDLNCVKLSSIPKDVALEQRPVIVSFNESEFKKHCREYKDYTTWLKERNTARYVDIANHDQKIDGKNMLHCRRLIDMAFEIVNYRTITVRRPNAEELLKIRRGEIPLQELTEKANEDILLLNELYAKSDLPDECDPDFVYDLLLQVRKKFYNI